MHRSTTRQARDTGSNGLAIKLSHVALASAALIFVAPLMVLVLMVSRVDRRRSAASGRDPRTTWLATLLYKSSLAELPQLLDVVRGRISRLARDAAPKRVDVNNADRPKFNRQALSSIPADPGHDLKPSYELVRIADTLQVIGCHLRDVFFARATAEFDDLLRAIDRARSSLADELAMPSGASMKAV